MPTLKGVVNQILPDPDPRDDDDDCDLATTAILVIKLAAFWSM